MSCKFCVTGLHGLKRNLTAGEIIEQVLLLSKIVKPTAIVFMGQGEPINNYKNVKISIMNLKDHHGFNFSAKKITVSTSGLIPGLIKLQKETGIKMAYSLNATNQNDRTRIMDVNKIIDFEEKEPGRPLQYYIFHQYYGINHLLQQQHLFPVRLMQWHYLM